MPTKHKILIAVGVGIAAGLYFANAPTQTGIYATKPFGQILANLYVAGAKLGGGTAPAVANVTTAVNPVTSAA